MKRALVAILLLLLAAGAMAAKGLLVEVPPAAAAREAGFDADRAFARLQRILAEGRPHSVDSAANDRVRARLLAELRGLGLSPRVADDFACNGSEESRTIACARVRNVVATLGDPARAGHLLLASHYDSSGASPGAADDGIGMATMLETAAALRGEAPARPVTLLFTDGEEVGLLGARAFVDRDPLAGRIAALVNLEARGVTGPAFMFETSRPNAAAVAAFSAVDRPVGNSLTTDFYRMIPNSTDVAVFEERGWTTLNFAIMGNETRYHSPGDDLAALDRDSLGHMGAQALTVSHRLASAEPSAAEGERLYTDLLGRALLVLPLWLGLALLFLLLAGAGWAAWRRRPGLARAALLVPAAMAASALLAFLLQLALGLLRGGDYWRAFPGLTALAVELLALLAAGLLLVRFAGRLDRGTLRAAYWLVFLLIGALLSSAAPGAAIFFLAPPAVALAGMALGGRVERPAALLAWALLFLAWGPLLHFSQILLGMAAGWMFAPVAALILLPLLIEMKPLLLSLPKRTRRLALAVPALAAWLAAAFAPAYSEERKQAFGIEHALTEEGPRWLVVNDGAALPAGFEGFEPGTEVPWSPRRRWSAPAPMPRLAPPRLEKLAERRTPAGRLLSFRLRAGGAETLILRAEPEAALKAVRAGGAVRRFGAGASDEEDFTFRCHGRSCEGLVLHLLTGSEAPAEAVLVGMRGGLDPAAAPLLAARPARAQPQYTPDSTVAVSKLQL